MQVSLNDKTTKTGLHQKLMYSKGIGWNLLSRIIKDLGTEVLFQFGVTKQRLNRMLTKGLLGGELDLMIAIHGARGNFEVKYIKPREYELLTKLINKFTEYRYLKPVFMLALQPSFAGRHIKVIKDRKPYEDIIFNGDYRPIIDRTLFYDAFIYYILELDKFYTINNTATIEMCSKNLAHTDNKPWRIFFNWFSYLKLESHSGNYETILAKKPGGFESLPRLANYIRTVHRQQGIANVQAYNKSMTGQILKKKFNHTFVNFSAHGKLYNPLLQSIRIEFFHINKKKASVPPLPFKDPVI